MAVVVYEVRLPDRTAPILRLSAPIPQRAGHERPSAQNGAGWAIMTSGKRFRLFRCQNSESQQTGRYVEFDTGLLQPGDLFYLGLLSPESLQSGGWLSRWEESAQDHGA